MTGVNYIFQDPRSLLTYSGQSWPCKSTWKKQDFIFYRNPLHYGITLSVLALLTSLSSSSSSVVAAVAYQLSTLKHFNIFGDVLCITSHNHWKAVLPLCRLGDGASAVTSWPAWWPYTRRSYSAVGDFRVRKPKTDDHDRLFDLRCIFKHELQLSSCTT